MKKINSSHSRRTFLKAATICGAGVGAALITGCTPGGSSEEGANTTGSASTYIGYGNGCKGEVSAYVTIEDGKIASVVPGPNHETEGPGSTAFNLLSKLIVDNQSVNLDTVSGATLTSMGYLNAAKEALGAAGMDDQFSAAATPETVERKDEEYDVVVVGSGGSGLMAALTAKYPGFDGIVSDTRVIVLEKTDIVGGSASLAGGSASVTDGLRANDVADLHVPTSDMIELLKLRSSQDVNEPLVDHMYRRSGEIIEDLTQFGGPHTTSAGTVAEYLGHSYLNAPANAHMSILDVEGKMLPRGLFTNEGGLALTSFMRSKILESETEIRTGAAVVKLNTENSKVTGVHVKEGMVEYDILAKKAILSCGGFGNNPEMLAELCTELPGILPFCCAGNTGDGFALTEELGVQQSGKGAIAYIGVDQSWGIYTLFGRAIRRKENIFVTEDGSRTFSEPDADEYDAAYYVCEAPGNRMVGICDSNSDMAALMEADALPTGRGYKADTLEELASLAKVDAGGLATTIEAYNAAYDAGENAEFGTPHDMMSPVKTAPFYAYDVKPLTIGTLTSLLVDDNCRILNQSNKPIENLYATGEMCIGGNVLSRLYMGGISIFTALSTGRIASEHAVSGI